MLKILWIGAAIVAIFVVSIVFGRAFSIDVLTKKNDLDSTSVAIVWEPRVLLGDGVAYVELRDSRNRVLDRRSLRAFDLKEDIIENIEKIEFKGETLTLIREETPSAAIRFAVVNHKLVPEKPKGSVL